MGKKCTPANIKRAWYYLKKNGLGAAVSAVSERLHSDYEAPYAYEVPDEAILRKQRERVWQQPTLFSLVVPAYETKEKYLRALLDSLKAQTYGHWELVLADASRTDCVEKAARAYGDTRIRYYKLEKNAGIAENTNAAILKAKGDYIGLLDHDDLLTPDALYEMASLLEQMERQGIRAGLLYSDEDKTEETGTLFHSPYRKPDFNESLLLSNNYICHFLVMEGALMKRLLERPSFDGAQDYDLILRAVLSLQPKQIGHVPKVLYHWRCHSDSTAQNPQSKRYAYEAGRRAVEDYCREKGWQVTVEHTRHLGFYRIAYIGGVLAQRPEVGAVGGRLLKKGRIVGGLYQQDGTVCFAGLPKSYSGYFHQAVLQQDAQAVDIRHVQVQPELTGLLERYQKQARQNGADWKESSLAFCREVKAKGYRILWDPFLEEKE